MAMKDTVNPKGARRSNIRSPRDVLEGDHKRPPGNIGKAEVNNKKFLMVIVRVVEWIILKKRVAKVEN